MQYACKTIICHNEAILEQRNTSPGHEKLRGACQLYPIAESQTPHVPKLIVLCKIHRVLIHAAAASDSREANRGV